MKSCLDCAIKHLGQAFVLSREAMLGYANKQYIAIGHLAEAESELVVDYPQIAEHIRSIRLGYKGGDLNLETAFKNIQDTIESSNDKDVKCNA